MFPKKRARLLIQQTDHSLDNCLLFSVYSHMCTLYDFFVLIFIFVRFTSDFLFSGKKAKVFLPVTPFPHKSDDNE